MALAVELPGGSVLFTGRQEGDLRDPAARVQLDAPPVALARQVHGTRVLAVEGPGALEAEADGVATVSGAVAPLVLTADCLPVALVAPGGVAMVHAGWRGLSAGVLEAGVAALGAAGDLHAAIGPGAGPCCYEVGDELRARFGTSARTLDLKAIARERLLAAGVAEVTDVGVCTICSPDHFSFRREGEAAGRQGGIAWRS